MSHLPKSLMTIPDMLGLVDDSVKLTYQQFKDEFMGIVERRVKEGKTSELLNAMHV